MFNNSLVKQTIALLVVLAALVIAPLVIRTDFQIGGTADPAAAMAGNSNDSDHASLTPVWDPIDGGMGGLLFCLLIAAGSGVLCYCIGYSRGKRNAKKDEQQ